MPTQHELVQGSPEWHQFRLEHFGASEAAAMLGLSSKVKRNELLHMKHTGEAKVFSDWFQKNVLDNGHAVEAATRPLAEAVIGDELYPATYSEGKLSASCDGLTMAGDTAWENKQWNAELANAVAAGQLPDEYMPQCQQVMMVTGAKRLLFTVSDGTTDNFLPLWILPDADWPKRITQGWTQFAYDLEAYTPPTDAPTPVAAAIETLPALVVQVEGRVLSTNLDQFKQTALTFFESIKTDLATDQDFVDADNQVKFLKDAEERLEAVKSQILGQTASIDEVFRTIDFLREQARAKRLTLDRLVDAKKKSIRTDIQRGGEQAMRDHIDALNKMIGHNYMPDIRWADFAAVMKNKRTISSLRDAVDTALAGAKIKADEIARTIQTNLNSLRDLAADYKFLFADAAQLVLKNNDDLVALIKVRIADHKAAEAVKAEQERVARELAEAKKREAEKPAAPVLPVGLDEAHQTGMVKPSGWPAQSGPIPEQKPVPVPPAMNFPERRPTDDEIVVAVALHFRVHESKAIEWMLAMDLKAASERMAKEFAA